MKKTHIPGLAVDRSDEGYEFFVESLDEMLFDYTMDSYKPPTHNASTLADELDDIINEIELGLIEKGNFEPVKEELRSILRSDPIAKKLVNIDFERLLNECSPEHLKQAKARISLFISAISPPAYMGACVQYLLQAIPEGRQKNVIRAVSRGWVTSLLRVGYTRRYISERLNDCFYANGGSPMPMRLGNFFGSFDLASKDYEIVFAGARIFKSFASGCATLGVEVSESHPAEISPIDLEKLTIRDAGRLYLRLSKIKALDRYAAQKKAEELLDVVTNIFCLFHHARQPVWSDFAWVRESLAGGGSLIGAPIRAVARSNDSRPAKAGAQMQSAVTEFQLTSESLDQFDRAVSLHGAANRAASASMQLLNLWSGLEAVVPSCVNGATIKGVILTMQPFIRLNYPSALLRDLVGDLYRHDLDALKVALRKVGKGGKRQVLDGVVQVMFAAEHSQVKSDLFVQLSGYPLLLNRCNALYERMKDATALKKTLDIHDQRVEWQLRRLYRTRNLYVHSGKKVVMLDTLVENAHAYLDTYFKGVFSLARMTPAPVTLDQSWLIATERVREWDGMLSAKPAFDVENVGSIVLGPLGST